MLLWMAPTAVAIDTEPTLPSPELQRRYDRLTHEVRCLVCQDESIADSSAALAATFRRIVHQQLLAGRSDAQIKSYLVARYGYYILLRPPIVPLTWLLWGGPFVLMGAGVLLLLRIVRRRAQLPDTPAALPESDWE